MDYWRTQRDVGLYRRILTMTIVVTLGLLLMLSWFDWAWKRSTEVSRNQMLFAKELQGTIVHLDEVLTMSAMMAATTGDISWEQRYRKFEPELDLAIKRALQVSAEQDIFAAVQTDEANMKLVAMENEAFDLVRAGKAEAAQDILFGEEYARQKKIYADGIVGLDRALHEMLRTGGIELACSDRWHQGIMASVIVFVALSWTIVFRSMLKSEKVLVDSHHELCRQADELVRANTELEQTNLRLSSEIEQRGLAEAKQHELHQELLGKSQQAALAELATGVLHNVGNALNSVNVATNFAVDQVAKNHMTDLGRATELIQEHKDNLSNFFTSHERGKLVLPFLEQLADTLRGEKESLLECLRELDQKVEHVKQIVRAQQTNAKAARAMSDFELCDLMEFEIATVQGNMEEHAIELVRDYQRVPTVHSDKHKVIQIVGNLIRNSVRALIDSGKDEKQLTVRIERTGENRVLVEVEDNGIGIDELALSKMFQYGFTTKIDGHGFGLHHSMLAAKHLGGELRVHSDGLGRGARFTLELPVDVAAHLAQHELAATT
jgi:signal transduction histidine kinase